MDWQIPKKTQSHSAITKQINVTDLTETKKQTLFINCVNQIGFAGFVKKEIGNQTYYTFFYET
ncbi:MAG: hypothetical protein M1540_03430 [Candidatus Bathyarchaeota archaeon]|nr:hypothetical protein [Candidatus Bathyarchaeota archaeon]